MFSLTHIDFYSISQAFSFRLLLIFMSMMWKGGNGKRNLIVNADKKMKNENENDKNRLVTFFSLSTTFLVRLRRCKN